MSKFYGTPTQGVELFLLRDGGVYPLVFWVGQMLLGSLAPLFLLATKSDESGGARNSPGLPRFS